MITDPVTAGPTPRSRTWSGFARTTGSQASPGHSDEGKGCVNRDQTRHQFEKDLSRKVAES